MSTILHEFANNVLHNLFKPLLLFFYMGFLIPILKVPFEFPKVIYQGITIYLLISIGWHGGEKLAELNTHEFLQAGGFMTVGFFVNAFIGYLAYLFFGDSPSCAGSMPRRSAHTTARTLPAHLRPAWACWAVWSSPKKRCASKDC